MAYAPRNGEYVTTETLLAAAQCALGSIRGITDNFNATLDRRVQNVAFGPPGTPGDVDAIRHVAERFASVYTDYLNWAREMRGVRSNTDYVEAAFHGFAHAVDQPVEAMRDFVRRFAAEGDSINERLDRGEKVHIEMVITITLQDRVLNRFLHDVKMAYKRQ